MFRRSLNIPLSNSFFLFGARGTGKTSLIEELLAKTPHLMLDLLDDKIVRRFRKDPQSLARELSAFQEKTPSRWVFIDEAQKTPQLLGVVQQLIEKNKINFALTGSSARKLKRGAANLLAGRAFVFHLFPLTFVELGARFDLQEILEFGSLPKVFALANAQEKKLFLRAYAHTYVKEEVVAEQLARSLDPFQDFLEISAQMSGKIINAAKIARDVGVDPKTVAKYYAILEETWMGFHVPGYHRSLRKAQRIAPKFYWFDLGVRRALEDTLDFPPGPGTSYFGECFEQLVVNEIYRLNHYSQKHYKMSYLATHNSGTEADIILERGNKRETIVIEIKSATGIDSARVEKLSGLLKDFPTAKMYYLSNCLTAEKFAGVSCQYWQDGLREIFGF